MCLKKIRKKMRKIVDSRTFILSFLNHEKNRRKLQPTTFPLLCDLNQTFTQFTHLKNYLEISE
jgi:hypothetical protein